MNREIKFRYKIKGRDELLYDTSDEFAYLSRHGTVATMRGGILTVEDRQQFTELRDKNGVEIYEGDQIELLNCSPRFWTVEMDQGCWCGIWRSEGVIDARCPVAELVADGARVIGNIHENPELLCN